MLILLVVIIAVYAEQQHDDMEMAEHKKKAHVVYVPVYVKPSKILIYFCKL